MHRFSPLLLDAVDDTESDDEAPPTPPYLGRRNGKKQTRSSSDHEETEFSEKRSKKEHDDRPAWAQNYLSPIDSDVEDDSVKRCGRGRPKSSRSPTKSAPQDTASVKEQEKLKRRPTAKQIQSAYISPVESESESISDELKVTQRKKGRPRKVKQAQDIPESPEQESKTGAISKLQANKCITTDTDPRAEVAAKRTKKLKAPTSKKSKGRRSTTPSQNHSLSDLDDTAGESKTSDQDFQERSSDLEDDRLWTKSPEHSDKHIDDSDSKTEPASLKQSSHKLRKSRCSPKDCSSSSESEDKKKKQRRKKKKALKDCSLDFLEWPIGSSSARPRGKKKERERKRKRGGPIECKVCGRSIRCKAVMERHMLTHTGEKPFECEDCGRRYTSSSNLRIHQQSHTGKMDYACEECGQKFTHLSYLKRHLLRHLDKKLHICETCGKGFNQKYHLNRHLLVHSGKVPYACDKCDASFNRTDYLSLHMRNVHLCEYTHKYDTNRPFKCDSCDKAFSARSTLVAHERVHSGIAPYSCPVCQRKFKQSCQMHSHMRTHSGEKPHPCDVCGMKFARRNYVKIHKERRHSVKKTLLESS